jgi:hypothetical protein
MKIKRLLLLVLLLPLPCFAQSWSNVLSSSRAISWTGAGLPATLPDGETTTNPWTPPTRTQCGSTIASGASPATINAALAACSAGTYVLLGAGTFTFSSANLTLYAQNGVTLRGSGAQATKIILSGTSTIYFGHANNLGLCSVSSGYSTGSTSLTTGTCSGSTLVAGTLVSLQQCDTGYSGTITGTSISCTGTSTDNGGLYICGGGNCNSGGTGPGDNFLNQQQMLYVTSVSGSTVQFSPAIYAPNWASGNTPVLTWVAPGLGVAMSYGEGLEDLTVDMTACTANAGVNLTNTYASWVKGIRLVGGGGSNNESLYEEDSKSSLIANDYFFGSSTFNGVLFLVQMGGNDEGGDGDNLFINNIGTNGTLWEGSGSTEGDVIAYNYNRDAQTAYSFNRLYQHIPGSAFTLYEGNEVGQTEDDDTWGSHDLNTWFRNYVSGWDGPYQPSLQVGIEFDSFGRFENAVGNSIGSAQLTNYVSTYSNPENNAVVNLDISSSDPLTINSALRWGNCDTVTGTCRFVSSEVPTSLSGNAAPFENSVPSNDNLPCSFFLAGYAGTTCTPKYGGGTGLSFWKVCKTWTTFPTSCATTQTQPFPIAGPDITSGLYVNGTAYDNPAEVAFLNLPIDANYQSSFTITGSSWSGGTETLTVSGLSGTSTHIMGPFQISGGACSTGSGEVYITTSTSTTIQYALASNPGSCTGGTMLFPDVRQFDERVYGTDTASSAGGSIATQNTKRTANTIQQ